MCRFESIHYVINIDIASSFKVFSEFDSIFLLCITSLNQ